MAHKITELRGWERLFKRIVWEQIGELADMEILDFGSGEGITADHFAVRNDVTAIEPSYDMLSTAWKDFDYLQLVGSIDKLKKLDDNSFDFVICHNVLEYIEDKASVVNELVRVLKPGGTLSIVKHNRLGRVMQMAVLLDDTEKANSILDGNGSTASRFGQIRYYEDSDILRWNKCLSLEKTYGIRTFWDLQQKQEKHEKEEWQERMMQLEMRVSEIKEFSDIAFFHHLLFEKNAE